MEKFVVCDTTYSTDGDGLLYTLKKFFFPKLRFKLLPISVTLYIPDILVEMFLLDFFNFIFFYTSFLHNEKYNDSEEGI